MEYKLDCQSDFRHSLNTCTYIDHTCKSNIKVVDKQQEREKGKQFQIAFQKVIIESYVYHFQTLLFCTNSDLRHMIHFWTRNWKSKCHRW